MRTEEEEDDMDDDEAADAAEEGVITAIIRSNLTFTPCSLQNAALA